MSSCLHHHHNKLTRKTINADNICTTTTENKAQEYTTEPMDIMYGTHQEDDNESQILFPIKVNHTR